MTEVHTAYVTRVKKELWQLQNSNEWPTSVTGDCDRRLNWVFADHVVLMFSGQSVSSIEEETNHALARLHYWGVRNKLRLSPSGQGDVESKFGSREDHIHYPDRTYRSPHSVPDSALILSRLLPLDIRVREAACLYEVKRGKDLGDTFVDRQLETSVYFDDLPHPAHVPEIGYESIEEHVDELTSHDAQVSCRRRRVEPYVCEVCGKEFRKAFPLNQHRAIHSNEFLYTCTLCPYRGRTRAALVGHAKLHSGEKTIQCPQCPATFASYSNLGSHRRTHNPPKYKCYHCNKNFMFQQINSPPPMALPTLWCHTDRIEGASQDTDTT
ncbi:Zinc finger protein 287 [Eumeta japonica]|uniref:Zinc finger protein 287 n=1 Tax=Eumeta variegata TaxID=151549 RepID=A0A4C1X1I2_EUMVA|nr:Zinc finger protein 287 [Eumeta japonica]